MKALQNFQKKLFILLLLVYTALSSPLYAQSAKADKQAEKAAVIRNLVDSQNYVFLAQSAMPMSGPVRQLTSDYDLSVTKSKVVSYLPYFGRAYAAPIDPSHSGIQFTYRKILITRLQSGKKEAGISRSGQRIIRMCNH